MHILKYSALSYDGWQVYENISEKLDCSLLERVSFILCEL